MRVALFIAVCLGCLIGATTAHTAQQGSSPAATHAASQPIDGVAARIEDDILTDSEVRELGAFQELVDGHAKSRDELIRELADQWIVRGEIETAKYPPPSAEDVDRAYAGLVSQFASAEDFAKRCSTAGLSEAAVRRLLQQQLYLSRFLDFRFRPAAQVDSKQIEAFYDKELVPQLKTKNQTVPSLEDVEDTIREVLVQRAINQRATQWLDDTRNRLKIDVVTHGAQP